jgi:hypothetical protein
VLQNSAVVGQTSPVWFRYRKTISKQYILRLRITCIKWIHISVHQHILFTEVITESQDISSRIKVFVLVLMCWSILHLKVELQLTLHNWWDSRFSYSLINTENKLQNNGISASLTWLLTERLQPINIEVVQFVHPHKH